MMSNEEAVEWVTRCWLRRILTDMTCTWLPGPAVTQVSFDMICGREDM